MTSQEPLPTPRHVLTSLINSLAGTTTTTTASSFQGEPAASSRSNLQNTNAGANVRGNVGGMRNANVRAKWNVGTSPNPFKGLPMEKRRVLMTLHVVFPAVVLPALDLLDRGLVEEVEVVGGEGRGEGEGGGVGGGGGGGGGGDERGVEAGRDGAGEDIGRITEARLGSRGGADIEEEVGVQGEKTTPEDDAKTQMQQAEVGAIGNTYPPANPSDPDPLRHRHAHRQAPTPPAQSPSIYLVRSARPSKPGGGGGGSRGKPQGAAGGGKRYIVRPQAWNCSCAAFAFSAFPPAVDAAGGGALRGENAAASMPERAVGVAEGNEGRGRGGGSPGGAARRMGDGMMDEPGPETEPEKEKETRTEEEEEEEEARTEPGPKRKRDARSQERHGKYSHISDEVGDSGPEQDGDDDEDDDDAWSFGGLSLTGLLPISPSLPTSTSGTSSIITTTTSTSGSAQSTPPCCKHLLASILASRWPDVLGPYVKHRRVSKAEMAGLVAEL